MKIGRQKKIQIIDGQHVEVLTGEDDEDEEEYEDEDDLDDELVGGVGHPGEHQKMMAVQGQDGQQYVVLEVIQLPENNGTSATNSAEQNDVKPKINIVSKSAATPPSKKVSLATPTTSNNKMISEQKKADISNAFGFDDDEDDE